MKKVFSLVVILFCLAGSIWGQTVPTIVGGKLSETNITCKGNDNGTISGTIFPGTGPNVPPYNIYLYKNGIIQNDKTIVNTSDLSFTFTGLGPVALNGYRVRIGPGGGTTQTSPTYYATITEPTALQFIGAPVILDENCGEPGSVTIQVGGGTPNYTMVITYPDSHTEQKTASGLFEFKDLSAGTYLFEAYDKNGCGHIQTSATIDPSSSVNAHEDLAQHQDVKCFGASTGGFEVVADGTYDFYDFYLDGNYYTSDPTSLVVTNFPAGTYEVIASVGNCLSKIITVTINQPAAALTLNCDSTRTSCSGLNDGTITATASGGVLNYTYSIVPFGNQSTPGVFTGLQAGTYTITVTDGNACTAQKVVGIGKPAPIAFAYDAVSPKCNNESTGSITVKNVTGGTGSYTYALSGTVTKVPQISPSFTGLPEGTYTVTVKDGNGCEKVEANIVLTNPVLLEVDGVPTVTGVTCFGGNNGSIVIAAKGGTPDVAPNQYTFACSNGTTLKGVSASFTGLTAGTYTVTITDKNNCKVVVSNLVVSSNAKLFAGITLHEDVSCNGLADGKLTAEGKGGDGNNTYVWSNGATTAAITGLTSGNYKVTVTDHGGVNGCSSDTTVTITQPVLLTVGFSNQVDNTCFGGNTGAVTANPAGGTAPYTFVWAPAPGSVSSTPTSSTATGLTAQGYTVTVTDAKNCTVSGTATIIQPAGLTVTATPEKLAPLNCVDETTKITVTVAPAGSYQYQLNGGAWQDSNVFDNIIVGTYTIRVRYKTTGDNCPFAGSTTLKINGNPTDITFTPTITNNVCIGGNQGAISITNVVPAAGTYEYQFKQGATIIQDFSPSNQVSGLSQGSYTIVVRNSEGCISTGFADLVDPAAITPVATPTPATCPGVADGKIDVNVTGGTGTFNYTINPGAVTIPGAGNHVTFENLTAGTYTVTVSETLQATCAATTGTITVTAPKAITFTATAEDPTVPCKGDKTKITISNVVGEPGLTIEFSLDQTNWQTELEFANVAAGTFTVYAQYQGRTCALVTHPVDITEPAVDLDITAIVNNNPTCHEGTDGAATATANGGWGSYTYWWENSSGVKVFDGAAATGLSGGNYTVYAKDVEGCTTQPFNVAILPVDPITVQPVVTTAVSCEGQADGIATVTATGGNAGAYKYAWDSDDVADAVSSNSKNNLAAGNHYVVVFDSKDCSSGRINFTIDNRPALTITFNKKDASCDGATDGEATAIISPDDNGNYVYQWTPSAQSTKTATGLGKGTYKVTVAYAESQTCAFTSPNVTINSPAPIVVTNVTVANTGLLCAGETTTLTVTASGDPGETLVYSLDGTTWQTANTFDVAASATPYTAWVAYRVPATDVKCVRQITEFPVTVNGRPAITITSAVANATLLPCDQLTTTVTITATGENGTNSLEYRIDPSASWQANNTFNASAGTYTACVRYASAPNCPVCYSPDIVIKRDIDIVVSDVQVTGTPLDCTDSKTATITITASGNGNALEYGLKLGAQTTWQSSNTFTNLGAGSYEALVRYQGSTCVQTGGIKTITAPAAISPITVVVGKNALDCATDVTTVTLSATGESTRTIEYSINGTDWNTTGVFNNVPAGSYQAMARYQSPAPACAASGQAIIITAPAAIQITNVVAAKTTLDCSDEKTQISITATGEAGYPLEYSIDGGTTWHANNIFTGVGAGNYNIAVRYKAPASACQVAWPSTITISAPAAIVITGFISDIATIPCNNPSTKAILTITATGGPNMEYSIDNGTTWLANGGVFANMGVGTYTACVRYAGTTCQTCYPTPVTVNSSGNITSVTLTAVDDKLNCNELSTTLTVSVVPLTPASGSYEYELNNSGNWVDKTTLESTLISVAGVYVVKVRNTNDPTCVQASNSVKIVKPESITATVVIEDAACHDGQTNITVTAVGSLPMTYRLVPSGGGAPLINLTGIFTNVPDGTYTSIVSYTDVSFSSCSFTSANIVASKPAAIVITDVVAGATELTCDNATTTVTVVATGSKTMEYSLDGVNWQDANVFTVGAGTYTAYARYKTLSPDKCTVTADPSMTVTITAWAPIVMIVNPDKTTLECNEPSVNVQVTATGETGKAIEFSVNGTTWVPAVAGEYTFTLAAGAYTISARYHDNTSCIVSEPLTINQNINITIDQVIVGKANLDCTGDVTTIEIKATGEAGKTMEYTIDGVNWTTTSTFSNVGPGAYHIAVRYAGGTCAKQYGTVVNITAPSGIQITAVTIDGVATNHADLDCNGQRAVIVVTATGSKALEYSIREGEWQSGNTFNDVPGGSYTVKVRYAGGTCEVFYPAAITVFEPAAINISSATAAKTSLDCAGETTTITINATGEQKAGFELQYSIDGGLTWQTSKDFPNIGAGTYQPRVRYANHTTCTAVQAASITVIVPQPIVITSVIPVTSPLPCDGSTTKIDVVATGEPGRTLEYSIDNTNWYDLANLPGVGTGVFTVYVRYAQPYAACSVQASGSVSSSVDIINVVATADKTDLTCASGDVATITVTVDSWNNAKTLQYRINHGPWQDSNVFTVSEGGHYIAEVSYKEDVPPCPQPSNEIVITKPAPINIIKVDVDYGKTALDCNGDKTNITVYATGASGQPLFYTLIINGTPMPPTNSNVFNVGAGVYGISVSYAGDACSVAYNQAITITQPAPITITTVTNSGDIQCEGDVATLTVAASGDASRTLEYSADGSQWQSSNKLQVGPGTYNNIQVRYKQPDFPSCAVIYSSTITVGAPDLITITGVVADKTSVDCATSETATITVSATSSNAARSLEYSFDGGANWSNVSTKAVTSGSYAVMVRFANAPNCPKAAGSIVIQGNADIQFSNVGVSTPILCVGGKGSISATIISTASPQATDLQMSINGGAWVNVTSGVAHVFNNLDAGDYTIRARSLAVPACVAVSTPPVHLAAPDPIVVSVVAQIDATGCYIGTETSGSATIGVTGGTAPYKYQVDSETIWHNFTGNTVIIGGLKSGKHTIRVSDANDCTAGVANVTINNPDMINIVASAVSIRCYGEANGQLTIRVTQGHAPFTVKVDAQATFNNQGKPISPAYHQTFTISNYSDALVINGLYANTYMITVNDANTCIGTKEIKISQPTDPLELTITPINICPGESQGGYVPRTDGGWPGYNYYWFYRNDPANDFAAMYPDGSGNPTNQSPARNELDAGEYQVIAVDFATCSDTSVFEIIDIKPMHVDGFRTHGIVCKNPNSGSIKVVNPQGGANGYYVYRVRYQNGGAIVPGFEYKEWPNDSIYGLSTGTYIVDMLDHKGMGCNPLTTENLVIGVESGIVIGVINLVNPNCFYSNDGKINGVAISGSTTAPLEYKLKYWNGAEIGWQSTAVFDTISTGDYTLYVREKDGLGNGCEAEKPFTVDNPKEINIVITEKLDPNCDNNPQGFINFEAWGGTGNLAVTYNGTPVTGTFDPVDQKWKFHEEPNKGGWTIIEATDANGCHDTIMRKIPYATDLVFDKVRIIPNKCPGDINAQIKAIASDQKGSPHTSFAYRLYTGKATIPANLVKEIVISPNLTDTATFAGLANGFYTLSMQVDGNGCFTNDSVVEITNTSNITLENENVVSDCPTSRIIFDIVGDPSNTSYSYSVNGGAKTPVTEPVINGVARNVIISGLIPGVYTITIYYGECEYTQSFPVPSKVKPTVTPHAVTGCFGGANGSIVITMDDNSGAPYKYWYNKQAPGVYLSFNTTLSATIKDLAAGDYKVVVQQFGGCYSDTIKVTVDDAPRMIIGFNETVPITCKGQYGEGDITVTGGVGPYTAATVPQSEGGYPPYATPPVISGLHLSNVTGGQYRIAITDNGTGCKDTLNLNIVAPQVVAIKASQPTITCATSANQTSSITVDVIKPASGNFTYKINNTPITTTTNKQYTFNSLVSGNYTVSVSEQGNNCLADTTVVLTIPMAMTVDAVVTPVDHGNCNFTANVTINVTGGTSPYIIKINGVTITGTTITNLINGDYHVEVWDANNCYADKIITVAVPKTIQVTATIRDVKCNQDGKGSIVITPATYTYTWEDGATGNARYDLNAGDYKVTISNGSCAIDSVFKVKASYTIDVTIAVDGADTHIFCPGADVVLNGLVMINGTPMSTTTPDAFANWVLPNGDTKEYLTNNPLILTATTGTIQLTASSGGCTSLATFEMETKPTPTLAFATDTVYIPKDESYELKMDASGFATYSWVSVPDASYAQGLPIPPAPVTLASPDTPYSLILTLTGDNGCSVSDTIYVSRALDFFIPNAFTPNDDGTHDTWKFRNIEQYIDYYDIQVAVFNRGGFQVYSGNGYNNSSVVWDGRRNGNDLPIGTYYYVVKLVPKSSTGATHTFTGSVTIIR